jgi:hypothetical protein
MQLERMLAKGVHVRFLLMDPNDETLLKVAVLPNAIVTTPMALRRRILASIVDIEDIVAIRGNMELRVCSFIPSFGANAIDIGRSDGVIFVQHYEHQPRVESAPIFALNAPDGYWYDRFRAELERMWNDSRPWQWTNDGEAP